MSRRKKTIAAGNIVRREIKMDFMVVSNFAVLIAREKLRIAQVSRDTGIARSTLTNLYYSKNCAVSLSTLATLCGYLSCSIGDLLVLAPCISKKEDAPCQHCHACAPQKV